MSEQPRTSAESRGVQLDEQEHVLSTSLDRRNELNNSMLDTQMQIVHTQIQNGELENAANLRFNRELPQNLNNLSATYGPALQSYKPTISHTLNQEPDAQNAMNEIIDALAQPVSDGAEDHRYVRMKSFSNAPDWYGINFKQVEKDKAMIAALKKAHPEQQDMYAYIEGALHDYANQDPRRAAIFNRERIKSPSDQAIGKMGQMTLFLGASAIAIGLGALWAGTMYKQWREGKEGDKKSMHWDKIGAFVAFAAVAGLVANPTLRRRILSSADQNMVKDIDETLNRPEFKRLALNYNIAGPSWRILADTIMEDGQETKVLMKELVPYYGKGPLPAEKQEMVRTYVNNAIPSTDPEARANLERMIIDGEFVSFVRSIQAAKHPDARSVILDYIGQGSIRFEREAALQTQNMHTPPPIPSGYPNGTLDGSNLFMQ